MASDSPFKHCVVALDAWLQLPKFNFDHDAFVIPNGTIDPDPAILQKATIFMTSGTPVPERILSQAPNLQLVSCNGTGTDHVDRAVLKQRGIALSRVPAQNTDSVSEHAFAMYYALRRRIIPMHEFVMEGKQWPAKRIAHTTFGLPTRVNSEETMHQTTLTIVNCIIGYGALGKNIERIAKALGMKVIIAERKGASVTRPERTSFDEAIKIATVFILVTPLDDSTRNMIGQSELATMDPTALIVNVGRGGVIDEQALVDALREKKIAGAATDVFAKEPVGLGDSPLLDESIPNLILSPHIAWYSSLTIKNTRAMVQANIEAFAAGTPQNLVAI